MCSSTSGVAVLVALLIDVPILAANYMAIDLGTLPGTYNSVAYAVNDGSQIVGQSDSRAFFWDKHVMVDMGSLGGYGTEISTSRHALNNSGQAVGWSTTSGGQRHAFVWQNGVMTDLGTLTEETNLASSANAINDVGQIVGQSGAYINGQLVNHAVLWQNGTPTDLGATLASADSAATGINAVGQVIGWALMADGTTHAVFWDNDGAATDIGELLSTNGVCCSSYAMDINALGDVALYAFSPAPYPLNSLYTFELGYVWTKGRFQVLGTLGGTSSPYTELGGPGASVPYAINDSGQVVGESNLSPFLWQTGQTTQLATPPVVNPCFGGSSPGSAQAINRSGSIAGYAETCVHIDSALLWQDGQLVDLGNAGSGSARANAINNSGWVVGFNSFSTYNNGEAAALWVPNTPPVADASATLTQVISPNNNWATVTLDGSRSSDTDGDPLTYTWFSMGPVFFGQIGTGAKFPTGQVIGTATYQLQVSDGWVTPSANVTITVITAAQAVNNLAAQVTAAGLPAGLTNTLLSDLNAAASSFNKGNFKAGVSQLQTFISDVSAQSGKKIDPAVAATLIAGADTIINAVSAG